MVKKSKIVQLHPQKSRCVFHGVIILLLTLAIGVVRWVLEDQIEVVNRSSSLPSSSCDLGRGKWVYDNRSRPVYGGRTCKYMSNEFACEEYGRVDLTYLSWRWQPHDCDLPRFNATRLLEKLRNKRLVYVGDSVNRNQWVSLVCMLEASIPSHLKTLIGYGSVKSFKAMEYNASIEFYWSPLLVESTGDDAVDHRSPELIVRAQSIEKHGRRWADSDILVFDSYIWWRAYPNLNVLWGSFGSGDGIRKQVNMLRVYEMALRTWSDWLEIQVNRTKTKVFFTSMSHAHRWADQWGGGKEENCYSESKPVLDEEDWRKNELDTKMMQILDEAIIKLKTRGVDIQVINITQLSMYRKDAHPTIYRWQWKNLTSEQLSNPKTYSDCTHWCLPGVPDVWNNFLYSYFLS